LKLPPWPHRLNRLRQHIGQRPFGRRDQPPMPEGGQVDLFDQRYSIATFWPSTYPVSPRLRRKTARFAAKESGEPALRYPTTGIVGCCARAASGHVAAALPSRVTKSRRLMCSPQAEGRILSRWVNVSVVHHSKFDSRLAAMGHKPRRRSGLRASLCPQCSTSDRVEILCTAVKDAKC
jgi:hypothetical protein